MDAVKRSRLIKGAIAIFVGLPGTLTLFPMAGFLAFGALLGLGEALVKGEFSRIPNMLPVLTWTVAGVLGVVGFWTWIFFSRRIKRRGRRIAAACVLAGVLAVSPFAFGGEWATALALLGIVFGLLICNWLLRPGTLADPDPPAAPAAP